MYCCRSSSSTVAVGSSSNSSNNNNINNDRSPGFFQMLFAIGLPLSVARFWQAIETGCGAHHQLIFDWHSVASSQSTD